MGVADRPWLLRGVVLALAIVVGVVAWLASDDDEAPVAATDARLVAEEDLGNLAALREQPIYWAGPIAGTEVEVTESADGSVQIRYLTEGVDVGEEPAAFLTVGTYPLPDPSAALDSFAAEPGSTVRRSPDRREVVTSGENPSSAYFASPDNSVQVEVYDPSPKRALGLALSDRVRPIG